MLALRPSDLALAVSRSRGFFPLLAWTDGRICTLARRSERLPLDPPVSSLAIAARAVFGKGAR